MLSWQLLSSLVPLKGKFTGGKEREVKERRMNEKWIGNVTLWIGQPYPGKVGCLLVPHDPVTWDACKNYNNDWTSKKESVNVKHVHFCTSYKIWEELLRRNRFLLRLSATSYAESVCKLLFPSLFSSLLLRWVQFLPPPMLHQQEFLHSTLPHQSSCSSSCLVSDRVETWRGRSCWHLESRSCWHLEKSSCCYLKKHLEGRNCELGRRSYWNLEGES